MARVPKLKLEIDLVEMFGSKVTDDGLRQSIGQAVIDKIAERTKSGKSVTGSAFKGYSEAYKKSLQFKAFGKSGTPDLTLTGDMLSNMDIIKATPTKIVIGFTDETENAKAYNHDTGDTVPKRHFFGVQQKELEAVAAEFADLVDRTETLESVRGTPDFRDRALKTIAELLLENQQSREDRGEDIG